MEAANAFRSAKYMLTGDQVLKHGFSKLLTTNNSNENKAMKLLPAPSCHLGDCNMKSNNNNNNNNKQGKKESVISAMNKLARGKLSLRAKILQVGGVEKVFRKIFEVSEGEQLLKASQCSLFTTAGPITGRLFISTEKLAFCSDKAIAKYSSPSGETLRHHYKVVIPLEKINEANQSEDMKKPSKKYLQVVTNDDFEFWFMGFLNYKRTVKCLHAALS